MSRNSDGPGDRVDDLGGAWTPGRAPRLGPKDSIAPLITRVGRFAKLDPAKPGPVWNRWKWAGLGLWATLLGGSFAKAWRDHEGPPKG